MTNTIVITGSEVYTSKTCTECGHIHQSLGGDKVFKCPSCNHTLPRDMNGALGFMLKALRDTAFTILQMVLLSLHCPGVSRTVSRECIS
ncbi:MULTISPECIES: zinc ribbon domain-containing protein [Aerosakkonema]|uniref:zinc ribbon domain-containing protein n=1 Tax=Aerosakkonema TaxID=1246629 RepID=UPI0035B845C5